MPPEDPAPEPKPLGFKITTPHPNRGGDPLTSKIEVDGRDLTDRTYAIEFAAAAGELPRLVLWRHAIDGAVIEGEGIVAVVDPNLTSADSDEVLRAVADRIRALDAQQVRDAAVKRTELAGHDQLAQCWLDAIADAIEAG